MERLTRGRVIVKLDGIRLVYDRNRDYDMEITQNMHEMSIEGIYYQLCFKFENRLSQRRID